MASSVLLAAVVAFFHAWQAAIVGRLHGCMAAMVCCKVVLPPDCWQDGGKHQ
jgi:hypothetical protein